MQRRIIAAVAAVLLAGIGAVLLYSYVNTAEARAMNSLATTDVLVATRVIPAGTLGSDLAPYTEFKKLPKIAVAPDAVTDAGALPALAGLAAVTDVQVGEQILPTRFAAPDTTASGDVEIPTDMMQVSLPIDVPRAVGAKVQPGDKVGLFITGTEKKSGDGITQLTLREVLVVRVQGGPPQGAGQENTDATAPSGSEVITFALRPEDATRVVYAAENQKIYLALEPKDGGHGVETITAKTVLK